MTQKFKLNNRKSIYIAAGLALATAAGINFVNQLVKPVSSTTTTLAVRMDAADANLRTIEYQDAETGKYVCDATGGTAPERKVVIAECNRAAKAAAKRTPG